MNDFEWWFKVSLYFVPLAFFIAIAMFGVLKVLGL